MNKFNFHYEKGVLKTKSQSKRFFFTMNIQLNDLLHFLKEKNKLIMTKAQNVVNVVKWIYLPFIAEIVYY